MSLFAFIILIVHFSVLLILCLFGLHRMSMVVRWLRYKNRKPLNPSPFEHLPTITVQIPLYNERFVAERVVDACAAFDYPADKLQIQIVDDSNDDTSALVAQRIDFHRSKGIHNIEHIQRQQRQGFKAGALRDAMESASGEYIAIFDADFLPEPSLLRSTIDYFSDTQVAVVQFRWEYLNRCSSFFTEAQAMILDAHFALEQQVRYASDMLFNFNGTAGIWRKEAIIDAGNWSADTLTEDMDLSYRAQMRGWKMLYLNDVTCAGEIPANMNAFKSQQHRWAKGAIQVMKKIIVRVWRSPFSLRKKIEATFHLGNNLAYALVLFDTLFLLIPSLWVREVYQVEQIYWLDFPLLAFSSGGHLVYLFFGQVALGRSKWTAFLYLPLLMLLGIQLAFNNARAGIEALMGRESEFVRTPKSGEQVRSKKSDDKNLQQFYHVVLPKGAVIEFIVALVYLGVLVWAASHEKWAVVPFLLLLIVGFMSTALSGVFNKLSFGKTS